MDIPGHLMQWHSSRRWLSSHHDHRRRIAPKCSRHHVKVVSTGKQITKNALPFNDGEIVACPFEPATARPLVNMSWIPIEQTNDRAAQAIINRNYEHKAAALRQL